MKVCHDFEIDEVEISSLKGQNGKALETLQKDDWIRRCRKHGDIFFNLWQKLKEEHFKTKGEEDENIEVKSGTICNRDGMLILSISPNISLFP